MEAAPLIGDLVKQPPGVDGRVELQDHLDYCGATEGSVAVIMVVFFC